MKNVVKIVLCCVMGVYLLFGLWRVFDDALSVPKTPASETNATVASSETQPQTESGYIVKAVSGKIAVEDISSGKIVRITDTRVSILPEKDRAQLKEGIVVKSKSELRSVLEDYCS